MKTTMKQLAAGTFIAFLLLAGNVNAKGTDVKASSQESIETTLQVEKWMTDDLVWNTNSTDVKHIVQEKEASLQLENWMTSEKTWNFSNNFVEEAEAGLELESWMMSEVTWNVNKSDSEPELTVENWMFDNNIWN